MQVLNQKQILQKIKRLAYEILENNYEAPELVLIGVNNNGATFSDMLTRELEHISDIPIVQAHIRLNPADPLSEDITLNTAIQNLNGKIVIVVDDVANTGRTVFYACKPLFDALPKKIEVAVLVDRKHKSFPINVDYVGLSLATTLEENIDVRIRNVEEMAVYLV